ncbi:hypothetical protein [Radiobacillus sp. PE A8.2]|uniref:hypothetical protein n=1 Tax=Radiobacillus sp. PE A8.2 TaxID=3380349 RepID=UPI003890341E
MKKLLFSLIGIIPVAIGGYFLFQAFFGNSDVMMTYLEETNPLTDSYNALVDEEMVLVENGSEEELTVYTEDTLIPGLEEVLADTKAYGDKIEEEELKTVHDIDVQSIEKYIEAEYAWLEGDYETSDALFAQSEALIVQFEDELNSLASKWGVEIEWDAEE